MAETLFTIVCFVTLGLWFVVFIVTTTVSDIRELSRASALRRHPHSRRWRHKPLIVVQFDGLPTPQAIKSLLHSSYRKLSFDITQPATENTLTLTIDSDDRLPKSALRDANQQLQFRSHKRVVEIIPIVYFPHTTYEFFRAYFAIASAPFVKIRDIMNVLPRHNEIPHLSRTTRVKKRDYLYALFAWWSKCVTLSFLLYVSYIAVVASQPFVLFVSLFVFLVYLIWSIMSYPLLTMREKILYIVLSPASLMYFIWRTIIAISSPFHYSYFFMRALHQTH